MYFAQNLFNLSNYNVRAERAFSCLKRIKTYLRSTIGQDRLSSLAILNIENEYTYHCLNLIDLDAVIDEFGNIIFHCSLIII